MVLRQDIGLICVNEFQMTRAGRQVILHPDGIGRRVNPTYDLISEKTEAETPERCPINALWICQILTMFHAAWIG